MDVTGYDRVNSEVLRRDGQAEWREWRAYRIAGGLLLAVIALAALVVWLAIRGQRVQVVVQVVQHDVDGHLLKVGVPMDLLGYQPQEGAVRNMLAEWVSKRHWRGEEDSTCVPAMTGAGSTCIPVAPHASNWRRPKSRIVPFRRAPSASRWISTVSPRRWAAIRCSGRPRRPRNITPGARSLVEYDLYGGPCGPKDDFGCGPQ